MMTGYGRIQTPAQSHRDLKEGFSRVTIYRAEPQAFDIERVQTLKDGSIRVYVRLIHGEPGERPWTWHVAPILVREDGHLVVDDVIWLKDEWWHSDLRLSEYIAQGCDGPRWVGYGKKSRKLKADG